MLRAVETKGRSSHTLLGPWGFLAAFFRFPYDAQVRTVAATNCGRVEGVLTMICVVWIGWMEMRVRLLMFVDRVDYFRAGAVGESGD